MSPQPIGDPPVVHVTENGSIEVEWCQKGPEYSTVLILRLSPLGAQRLAEQLRSAAATAISAATLHGTNWDGETF